MSTVADTLRAAKALIDTPEKWRKDGFRGGGQRCAFWAIFDAHDAGNCWNKTKAPFYQAIGVHDAYDIWLWNDAPERTHAEVMEAFDRAIALAEAEGA